MVSALTLLETDETPAGRARWSYVLLAETLRRISARPREDAALVSNIDDHPRNHAALAWGVGWRLSPAYDLTPTPMIGEDRRDLAMACGVQGRVASAANLRSECRRFLLDPDQAAAIIDDMERIVTGEWYRLARGCGVSEVDCAAVQRAYAYPGFRRGPVEGGGTGAPYRG